MSNKKLAIALCRVSSLEQLESNSLSHQRDNVLKAADELGVTIPEDGIWSGHVSSKQGVNYDRKDLREMLEYCKKHTSVKYLIVQEVDRFMRSPDEQVYFQVRFLQEVGVKIWYADKPELNKDDIYAGLMRYMEGFRAAGSNDERQRKSINGQTKALEEGRFPFSPKPGYKRGSEVGIQELHPTRGPALKHVLIRIAMHLVSPSQGLIELNQSTFTEGRSEYKMDKFRKILTDPFYAGIVEIKKQVNVRNENGLHEPIISKEQHIELLNIMAAKKKNQAGPRKNGNPKYPLSNHVHCDLCVDKTNGRYVGFDHGNGKSKTLLYEKYRCRACGRYTTREDLHSKVQRLFEQYSITPEGRKMLVSALSIVWKQQEGENLQESYRVKRKIESLEQTIANRVAAVTDPENASIRQDILAMIAREKETVAELEDQLRNLESTADNDLREFMTFSLAFVDSMGSKFLDISPENRLRCKQLVFPAGFYVDSDNRVYTPEISPLFRVASNKEAPAHTSGAPLVRVRRL